MRIRRLFSDLEYIFLNGCVNHIPIWHIRKLIYAVSGVKMGAKSRIAMGTVIVCPRGIAIGERTVINENCHLDGRGGLTIGDDVSISFGTVIITASHKINSDSFEYRTGSVKIEDHVWTGAHAIILDNTVLQSGVVIGAGSVIKDETQNGGVYVGNPAKLIKSRDSMDYKLDYSPFFR